MQKLPLVTTASQNRSRDTGLGAEPPTTFNWSFNETLPTLIKVDMGGSGAKLDLYWEISRFIYQLDRCVFM